MVFNNKITVFVFVYIHILEVICLEDNIPVGIKGLISKPPSGKYKVTNIYIDPLTGKLVIEYNDSPQL